MRTSSHTVPSPSPPCTNLYRGCASLQYSDGPCASPVDSQPLVPTSVEPCPHSLKFSTIAVRGSYPRYTGILCPPSRMPAIPDSCTNQSSSSRGRFAPRSRTSAFAAQAAGRNTFGSNRRSRPVGSGVLVFSRMAPCDGWGILTAAHVVDEFVLRGGLERIWIGSTMMVRSSDGRRPVGLQRMKETYVVRAGPQDDETVAPDIAWIGLAEADVPLDRGPRRRVLQSRHPPIEDPRRTCSGRVASWCTSPLRRQCHRRYARATTTVPALARVRSADDVQLNLCLSMCGEPVFPGTSPEEIHAFDFQVIQRTDEYGTLGDPVAGRLAPDSWKGMSGCGYWLLVFGGPDDPVCFRGPPGRYGVCPARSRA